MTGRGGAGAGGYYYKLGWNDEWKNASIYIDLLITLSLETRTVTMWSPLLHNFLPEAI